LVTYNVTTSWASKSKKRPIYDIQPSVVVIDVIVVLVVLVVIIIIVVVFVMVKIKPPSLDF